MGRGEEKRGGERRGGEQGRRAGEGRSPNVRDALTPLVESTASPNCTGVRETKKKHLDMPASGKTNRTSWTETTIGGPSGAAYSMRRNWTKCCVYRPTSRTDIGQSTTAINRSRPLATE